MWCGAQRSVSQAQARVEKSRAWVSISERRHGCPLLLPIEYVSAHSLNLCILVANIPVELSVFYLKMLTTLNLSSKPRSTQRAIFWNRLGHLHWLASPGKGWAVCTAKFTVSLNYYLRFLFYTGHWNRRFAKRGWSKWEEEGRGEAGSRLPWSYCHLGWKRVGK